MKALEILKEISIKCETDENFMGYAYDAKKVDKLIQKAIVELEEDMKPKTCEGCVYGVFGVDSFGLEIECTLAYRCSRVQNDMFKPKDNA